MAGVDHQIQAVDNGVFDDGLQGDFVAQAVQTALVHREMVGELVLIAVFLDLQVGFGVLQFFFNRDQFVPTADADAEEPRQRVDHLDGVGIFATFAHPGDGIERIVEEMRVDLSLQRLEFGLAQHNFLLAHGGHQPLDTAHHMPEGIREVLHLPRAAHRLERKVVGILLKLLHGGFQLLQGAGQRTGQHPAHDERRKQDQYGGSHSDAGHLPEALVDGLVDVADTDDAPRAARHALDAVNDGILDIGAVAEAGQTARFLLFPARVQKLLLRVVDPVAAFVHQVAVAVLANADVADGGSQLLEAQIHREPAPRSDTFRHNTDDRHDPGVVTFKNRLDVGRADVAVAQAAGGGQIKGKVPQNRILGFAVLLRPAVQQLAICIVGGDGCDLGPGGEERAQKGVAAGGVVVQPLHDDDDGAVHCADIVAHGPHDLADDLGTVRAGGLDHGAAVAAQKQRRAERQHRHRHGGNQRGGQGRSAGRALHAWASPAARARRRATGDVPLYFLKQ